MVDMLAGLSLEVNGYVGRILLNGSPFENDYFPISLVSLTIAPDFLPALVTNAYHA